MSDKDVDLLVTKHAAECVQELLNQVRDNTGISWFFIIERKMKWLANRVSRKSRTK